jgi:hypothetical protein
MSFRDYVLILTLGAGVIALWLDTRFGNVGPQTTGKTLVHLAASLGVLELCPIGLGLVVAGSDDPARQMVAVFFVLFPTLVYAFLAILWLLKMFQSVAHLR